MFGWTELQSRLFLFLLSEAFKCYQKYANMLSEISKREGTNYGIYLQFLSMRQGQIGGAERSLDFMFWLSLREMCACLASRYTDTLMFISRTCWNLHKGIFALSLWKHLIRLLQTPTSMNLQRSLHLPCRTSTVGKCLLLPMIRLNSGVTIPL